MKYITIDKNNKLIGRYDSDIHNVIPDGAVEVTDEQFNNSIEIGANYYDENTKTLIIKDFRTNAEKESELISEYKSYYLDVFNNKLKELDYDSIATVNMWAIKTGSTFQAEAKALLNWYEAIILKNYEILNKIKSGDIETPTKDEYLAMLPSYATYEI